MTIQPDDSEYGGQTVTGAAWPHIDEELLDATADEFDKLETYLRDVVVPASGGQRMKLSDFWEGTGAEAALDEASNIIREHEANEAAAKETSSNLRLMDFAIAFAKTAANQTAEQVQQDCEKIMGEEAPSEGEDDRSTRAANRVVEGYNANVKAVSEMAKWLANKLDVPPGTPGADGKAPAQKSPGIGGNEGNEGEKTSSDFGPHPPSARGPTVPASSGGNEGEKTTSYFSAPPPSTRSPAAPASSGGNEGDKTISNVSPATKQEPYAPADPTPSVVLPAPQEPGASASGAPAALSPSSSGAGTQGTQMSGSPSAGAARDAASPAKAGGLSADSAAAGAQPATPVEAFQKGMADAAKAAGPPQSAPQPSQPLGPPATAQPLNAPPPQSATPPPAAASPAAASGGMSGAGPAPVGAAPSAGAPSGSPMPLGPPPTPPPAGPSAPPGAGAVGPAGPPVVPAAAGAQASGGAQVAPIPVSAARAESYAASSAASMSRGSGTDPLELARRIAAALNAPPSIPKLPWKFGWATGLTAEGSIIVANTYGMGYIPKGVNLPEPVKMVTADESVPPGERARWVAHPYLALQGWAQHHEQRLRAVFGTEEQLQGIDPGASKVVLTSADIPENGTMQGRSRLKIVAPDVADRLATVPDTGLTELLPTRPADDTPPENMADALWFEMIKPLMRMGSGNDVAHLRAFVTYANHEHELALHRAHTAPDAITQRDAIADWIYWQHVSVLISDGLAASVSV